MQNVIFLSPPAAGKGTFSEFLKNNYHYQHISTGNILREKALHDEEIKNILNSGLLVSDEVMERLLKEKLEKINNNLPFILDGLPRTLKQARDLDKILVDLNINNYVVVYIDVPKEVLMKRILGRRICPKCQRTYNVNLDKFKPLDDELCDDCNVSLITRSDDNEASFMVRYQQYIDSTYPVVLYYKNKGLLKVIENLDNNQNVFDELVGVLND